MVNVNLWWLNARTRAGVVYADHFTVYLRGFSRPLGAPASRNNPDQSSMLCLLYPLVEHPLSADYGPLYFGLNIYRVVRKQGSFLYGTIHGIQKHEDDLEH